MRSDSKVFNTLPRAAYKRHFTNQRASALRSHDKFERIALCEDGRMFTGGLSLILFYFVEPGSLRGEIFVF